MSNSQFEAARQYIEEHDYDKAREILETMPDNPAAQKLLAELDEIALQFSAIGTSPSSDRAVPIGVFPVHGRPEKDKRLPFSQEYNDSLNEQILQTQKAERKAGTTLSVLGGGIILFSLIAILFIRTQTAALSVYHYGITAIFVILGALFLPVGLYRIWHASRPDKVHNTLMKGTAQNIKRASFLFLGIAAMSAFLGILTQQTYHFGLSLTWAILGGINLFYNLPRAQESDRQQALLRDGAKAKRSDVN